MQTKLEKFIEFFYKSEYENVIKQFRNNYVSREDVEDIIQEALLRMVKANEKTEIKNYNLYFKRTLKTTYLDYVYRQGKKRIPKNKLVPLFDNILNEKE